MLMAFNQIITLQIFNDNGNPRLVLTGYPHHVSKIHQSLSKGDSLDLIILNYLQVR